MTLVGKNYALISLGVSCQTSYQLFRHKKFLSEIIDDELEYCSCLFNWMISDIRDIPCFIDDFRNGKIHQGQIAGDPELGPGMPLKISDYRLWLWHEGQADKLSDSEVTKITEKYNYLLGKFLMLSDIKNRYFIISNSQSNLDTVLNEDLFSFHVSREAKEKLEMAINNVFPGNNKFFYVLYPGRTSLDAGCYHAMSKDESEWQGSDDEWARFFSSMTRKNIFEQFLGICKSWVK